MKNPSLPELFRRVQPCHELAVLSLQLVVGQHLEDLVLRLGRHVVHHDVGAPHVLQEGVLVEEARRVPDGHAARLPTEPGDEDVLKEGRELDVAKSQTLAEVCNLKEISEGRCLISVIS